MGSQVSTLTTGPEDGQETAPGCQGKEYFFGRCGSFAHRLVARQDAYGTENGS